MMEQDTTSRFDRRSMIKKGLVGAGIAATVPVISTFETAAFAASVPGCHRKQYLVSTSGSTISAVEQTPTTSGTCDPSGGGCTWAGTTSTVPTVSVSVDQGADTVTWTLTGSYASCEFVGGSSFRTSGSVCANPLAGAVFGSNTVTWTVPGTQNFEVRLLILC